MHTRGFFLLPADWEALCQETTLSQDTDEGS